MNTEKIPSHPPDHPFLNLFLNIIFPVIILNKGAPYLGPKGALIVAVSLPLIYGIQDYIRKGHKNYVSVLGLFNIGLTGSLALMNLHGIWFAFKEALLPFTLGLLVFFSAMTTAPAALIMFCNPHILNMKEIEAALERNTNGSTYLLLLKKTTIWLSLSFFVSSALNFFLAMRIFVNIDSTLSSDQQAEILNQQIAQMTWMSMPVIALPLMIFSGILITWFLRKLVVLTGLPMESLMKTS